MHIEPGLVTGGKAVLGYLTAIGSLSVIGSLALRTLNTSTSLLTFGVRSLITTLATLFMFQVLPHPPVGVSEVHLILGSTLFLLFGSGPAAFGLAAGLLLQGLLFAPFDLPQYGMNVTTLVVPLLAIQQLARHLIAPNTAYKDVTYKQALALSASYQAGIVAWVAFWTFYGEGFTTEALAGVSTFGVAYMSVILLEPLIDLGALALAKNLAHTRSSSLFNQRLYAAVATA